MFKIINRNFNLLGILWLFMNKSYSLFKRIKVVKSRQYDVLIWHKYNSEFIIKALPPNLYFWVYPNPNLELPIILTFSYIKGFVNNYICTKNIQSSIQLTFIQELRFKIIITYLANSGIPKYLNNFNQISLQYYIEGPNDSFQNYFNYFSWGWSSKEYFNRYKINYNKYFRIGSLKLGCFYDEVVKNLDNSCSQNYLALISCYRLIYEESSKCLDPVSVNRELDFNKEMHKLNISIKKSIQKLSFEDKYEIKIALANSKKTEAEIHSEINFYSSIKGNIELLPNFNLGSYKLCFFSKLVLTMESALGYEMLALGKKVIFIIRDETFMQYSNYAWNKSENLLYSNLPDILKSSSDHDELKNKIKYLEKLNQSEYLELTQPARDYYCISPENTTNNFKKLINNLITNHDFAN
jgi:hypothetical protein